MPGYKEIKAFRTDEFDYGCGDCGFSLVECVLEEFDNPAIAVYDGDKFEWPSDLRDRYIFKDNRKKSEAIIGIVSEIIFPYK